MFKQIKTLSALALSFMILATVSAQDFIKELTIQSQVSEKRLKELQTAAESLKESDVFSEAGTKNTNKFIYNKALAYWKAVNAKALAEPLSASPIVEIHEKALAEAVEIGKDKIVEIDKAKLEAEAKEKFPAYPVGATIKDQLFAPTPTRFIKISGKIKAITSVHVKVDFRDYKISDFKDPLFKQGLNAAKTRQARHNYVLRAVALAESERNDVIQEAYPKLFTAKILKNEEYGFIYISEAKKWMTPETLIKPMIDARITVIEKEIEERKKAAEVAKLAELKKINKVKKVLLGVNEEFVIQFEKMVVKDLVKLEQNKLIEEEKKRKLEEEQAAAIAEEKRKQEELAAAAAALKVKQDKAKKAKEAREAAATAKAEKEAQNKMYAMIGAGVVAAVFIFLFVNPKTREKLFTKKKKSLDQVVANLQTDDEADGEPAPVMEQSQGLTLDEQMDGDSKSAINLGVVPGHAPEEPVAPTLEASEAPSLEPPSLQAPGKSTGKPSLIINPDLQIKTDEGSKLKLKK